VAPSRSVGEWQAIALEAVRAFAASERAFTVMELEARLSDVQFQDFPPILPHHLTTARQTMQSRGELLYSFERTRGGSHVALLTAADKPKATGRAAARKRLLYTRYLGWTQSSAEWNPAPVPAGLEMVVHASLREAAPWGYGLVKPEGGEVRRLFGAAVPGGPMDNAAFLTKVDPTMSAPPQTTTILIEAKNLRQWIYPRTQEMYQLLSKAVSLQVKHPGARFVPVLVCRRINRITGTMARQIGAHLIETKTQYVRPTVLNIDDGQRKFDEVNAELGFNLTLSDGGNRNMRDQFTTTLPNRVDDAAERWHAFAHHPDVPDLVARLRDDEIDSTLRRHTIAELGSAVEDVTSETVRWAGSEFS